MTGDDWAAWHRTYDDDPTMAARLAEVQRGIRAALGYLPAGPISVVSLCAGDGRDLLGVLDGHPRAGDVRARLVDVSPALLAAGRERAQRLGLAGAEFVAGDAGSADRLAGAVPADLILLCGIFGNVADADVRTTIDHAPELAAPGATVIWTRGRFAPDLTPSIRGWFAAAGFAERSFVTIPGSDKSVGVHQLTAAPRPFRAGLRLFTFLPEAERPAFRAHRADGAREPARTVSP